jgi:GDP-mannose 6-dehydrogenase
VYSDISAPLVITTIEVAELLKYATNAWHALKVAFANEIGAICKRLKVDSWEAMDIFCSDTRLNLSRSYLRPGFAFGGSCLPKDVRALQHKMRMLDLETPLISSIIPSNRCHFERGLDLITLCNSRRIGILGLSFKAGTDDLRESPMVDMVERLIGKGYSVRIYDKNVQLAGLVGANRKYLLELIPHISSLMVPRIDDVLHESEILVLGNADPEFAGVGSRLRKNQTLRDLVGVARPSEGVDYQGVCW